MGINLATDNLLSLAAAARCLPSRSGRGVHVATVWRWSKHGVKGVVLETVHVGGIVYTSSEAVDRFITALSIKPATAPPSSTTSRTRSKEIAEAERRLEAAGV